MKSGSCSKTARRHVTTPQTRCIARCAGAGALLLAAFPGSTPSLAAEGAADGPARAWAAKIVHPQVTRGSEKAGHLVAKPQRLGRRPESPLNQKPFMASRSETPDVVTNRNIQAPSPDVASEAQVANPVAIKSNVLAGIQASTTAAVPDPQSDRRAESQAYVSAVQKFCAGIGPSAIEARTAWLRTTASQLEKDIAERAQRLDAKISEHRSWLDQRHAFAARAGEALAQLITRMRPEAAALQLAAMDDEIAAALIMRLDPKAAGPMMSEIPPAKAARLSSIIASAGELGSRPAARTKVSAAADPK